VLSSSGEISLPVGKGYFEQKTMLESEDVYLVNGKVNLDQFSWLPESEYMELLLGDLPAHIPYEAR
jgi:hypothetical protein